MPAGLGLSLLSPDDPAHFCHVCLFRSKAANRKLDPTRRPFSAHRNQSGIETTDVSMPGYALVRRTLRVVGRTVLEIAVYLIQGSGIHVNG